MKKLRIMKSIKYIIAIFGIAVVIIAALLTYPATIFSHKTEYGQFTIYSDRPIGPGWNHVLDDAVRRLETSNLYNKNTPFRIFVCNDSWRLLIFTRNASVGGFADTFLTRNIYLREAVVEKNQLVPPYGTLADAEARTLSYFVAHEATHIIQSHNFGRTFSIRSPKWLVEGHADFIAKAGDFNFKENLTLFRKDDPIMSDTYAKGGLYRRYHLMAEHVITNYDLSIEEIFQSPPPEVDIITELKSRPF